MSATAFQRTKFSTFRATNKIHLGKYEMDILLNDEFDYDGHTVRYAGMEYSVPQLQGLVGDWFVPIADTTTTYKSKPAGVIVSHATPEARERGDDFTMDEASEEEAVVGTMAEQKEIREAARDGNTKRLVELRAQRAKRKADLGIIPSAEHFDSNLDAPPPENAADVDPEIEAAFMEHTEQTYMKASPVHSAGAQAPLAPSENAKVLRANEINLQRIAAAHAKLERLDPAKTREEMGGNRHNSANEGRRVGKDGKYGLVVEDSGGQVVAKNYNFSPGASVGSDVVESGDVKPVNVTRVARNQPVQVGKAVAITPKRSKTGADVIDDPAVRNEPQAVRARQTTQIPRKGNVGIDAIHEGGATGDVDKAQYGSELTELLPDAAVAGSTRKEVAPVLSEEDEIAEIVEGWSIRRNWHKRVEEAVEFYADWPEAIDAICAKESEKVAAQIRSKLAQAEAAAKKS